MAQNTKKNPTPATRPAPAQKPKPPTTVEDLDDEDDLDDGEAPTKADGDEKEQSWKETMKLPPAKRVAVRCGNLVDRVQHQLDAMKSWTGDVQEAARAKVLAAQDLLKEAAESLASVPDDWKPARSAKGGGGSAAKELVAGDVVKLTDKRRPEYTDIISDENAVGMTVKDIRGNKVVCVMKDGLVAMLPRGHVTIDAAA